VNKTRAKIYKSIYFIYIDRRSSGAETISSGIEFQKLTIRKTSGTLCLRIPACPKFDKRMPVELTLGFAMHLVMYNIIRLDA